MACIFYAMNAVKNILIDAQDISVTEAAIILGVSRASVSKLINGRGGISPEMAVRLSIALNTSSEMWLNLQTNFDLFQAEKERKRV